MVTDWRVSTAAGRTVGTASASTLVRMPAGPSPARRRSAQWRPRRGRWLRRFPAPDRARIERAVGAEQGDEDEGGDDHRSHADQGPGQAGRAVRRPPASRTGSVRPRLPGRRDSARPQVPGGQSPRGREEQRVVGASATAGTASTTVGASASSADGSSAESGASASVAAPLDGMAGRPDVVAARMSAAVSVRKREHGAARDQVLVAAHRGHTAQLLGHRPRHERHPRRAADQQQGRRAARAPAQHDAIVRRKAPTVPVSTCGAISRSNVTPIKPGRRCRNSPRIGSAPRPRSRSSAPLSRECTRVGPARPASRRLPAATSGTCCSHQLVEVETAGGRRSPLGTPSTAKPPQRVPARRRRRAACRTGRPRSR